MQSTNNIFLVRPANFGFNVETAVSNAFQNEVSLAPLDVLIEAQKEFDNAVDILTKKGINVKVIDDTLSPIKPDAIFPNNWGSYHHDGTVILYPMLATNRRLEIRPDIVDWLKKGHSIKNVIDLSSSVCDDKFLEGTGSIVFDHVYKIAYACISPRTDVSLLKEVCRILNYNDVTFNAFDTTQKAIYHTNVMMHIGTQYAVVCLECIRDKDEQIRLIKHLKESEKEIVEISLDQVNSFCGNMLELSVPNKENLLVMSQSAYKSLNDVQKSTLSRYCDITPIPIETIEQTGGGSIRCMISEIFLPKK